jgi:putative peptidoglycan lipid II flippase
LSSDGHEREEKKKLVRSAGLVGALTLVSRVLGLARDAVIAAFFPKRLTDAFFVAFTIPNVLRRLLAEGALTIAFIPTFTDYHRHRSSAEAKDFVYSAYTTLCVVLFGVSIIGVLAAPGLVRLFAWGYVDDPQKFSTAVHLTQVMFPYIFFVSLTALAMGVLNTLGHFAGPAVSPALLNVAMIGSVVGLGALFEKMGIPLIYTLAVGVILGGLFQFALQLPLMARFGYLPKLRWNPGHPGVKRVVRLMGPAVFGLALYQLNVLLARLLASFLEHGAVTYLYYAQRLIEFPMGVFAVAVATAATPTFSAHVKAGDLDRMKTALGNSLRLTLFIVLPSMAGLVFLGKPLIAAFFQRGQFSYAMTEATYRALLAFTVGLWAAAAIRQLVPAYYALDDSKTPVKAAAVGLLVYVGAGLALMGPLGHVGLALAVSASSVVNVSILAVVLRKRLGRLGWTMVWRSVVRSALAAAVMGTGVFFLARLGHWPKGLSNLRNAGVLVGCLAAAALLYFGTAALLRCPELKELFDGLRRRKRKERQI